MASNQIPDQPGVYELYEGDELIYIGSSTVSIRGRVDRHTGGYEGSCTQRATFVRWQINPDPVGAERAMLLGFQANNGRLPRCNSLIP